MSEMSPKEPPIEDRLAHTADLAARLALEVVRVNAELLAARELLAAIIIDHGGRYSVPLRAVAEVNRSAVLNRLEEHDHVVFWLTDPPT